jgi:23S rRNA (uridine2552-2'-O)-methyltransferase
MANYKEADYWQQKAKKEGYPARSVYKLDEIDKKFGLLGGMQPGKYKRNTVFKILDLGSAPGSWSLYVMRKIITSAFLVSVDISLLSRQFDKGLFNKENFYFLQGDICDPAVKQKILSLGPYSLLLSDAAPSTSGNRSLDTARSMELAEAVINYAETALETGGNLLVKIFQGSDTETVLKKIKKLFSVGKSYKPQACRSESFETYYIGLGFNGSSSI